tara:strand:- start:639 stop:812 length:174 start_codon:yes stop_codon:yes gene_type:complete
MEFIAILLGMVVEAPTCAIIQELAPVPPTQVEIWDTDPPLPKDPYCGFTVDNVPYCC